VLPITQLAAWLFSINIRKVAAELREKVRLYQAEAVDVLYRHLVAPAAAGPTKPPLDPITGVCKAAVPRGATRRGPMPDDTGEMQAGRFDRRRAGRARHRPGRMDAARATDDPETTRRARWTCR